MTRNISLKATDPFLLAKTIATKLPLHNCFNGTVGSICHLKDLKQTKKNHYQVYHSNSDLIRMPSKCKFTLYIVFVTLIH